MANENFVMPYKLGFIAVTAAVLISYSDADYLPAKMYKPTANSVTSHSWESFTPGTYSQFSEISGDLIEQIDVLNSFALQFIENSENLKPEAISMINKRFWDLLA
jgi:hypothetical protein